MSDEMDSPQTVEEASAAMFDAMAKGDREAAERYNQLGAELASGEVGNEGGPADDDGFAYPLDTPADESVHSFATKLKNSHGFHVLDAWGGDVSSNVGFVRHAVEHFETTAPELVAFFNDDSQGKSPADDPDFVWAAAEYGKGLTARFEGWDNSAAPPAVERDVVDNAAQVLAATGGERLVADLGGAGTPQFARNLGYAAAARDHMAKSGPGKRLLAKLMRSDPRNPGLHVGDRPEIARAAVEMGRMLVHGRRNTSKRGNQQMKQQQGADRSADVDDLIAQQHAAIARGDKTKASRLETQIKAHFSQHSGQPIVGSGGRYA